MLKNHPTNHLTKEEQTNLQRCADYTSVQSLPEIWPLAAQRFDKIIALKDPHAVGAYDTAPVSFTYSELYQQIQQFAAGLQAIGF
ncbi:MAG: long-chain fatty acid--CoA ligase, partial [Symploca sp. SIO2D2]|nr:long-chain fatty acid--CoA ligase [Symploca sp. SIO2D2]